MPLMDKLFLRKRAIVETIVDPLKKTSQPNTLVITARSISWSSLCVVYLPIAIHPITLSRYMPTPCSRCLTRIHIHNDEKPFLIALSRVVQ